MDRLTELEKKNSILEGKVRYLNKRFYGKKSEKNNSKEPLVSINPSPKNRGQQPGSKGHGRTLRPEKLKVKNEVLEIPEKNEIRRRVLIYRKY